MRTYLILGLSIYLVLVCGPAHAKVYKWVDEKGKMHFTNDPSQIPKSKDTKVKTLREALPPIRNQTSPQLESDTSPEVPVKSLEDLPGVSKSRQSGKKDKPDIEKSGKSYKKLLRLAEESRSRKIEKINELKKLDYKPESWTTGESLEETIEGLKKSVKKSDEEIQRYKEKVRAARVED